MAPTLSAWIALVILSFCSFLVNAAPVDPNSILNQLKKNGACCTSLKYFLPDKVYTTTDVQYQSSQLTYWSAQEQSLHPTCIVSPNSTQDVSTAVTILSIGYQASIPGCEFAVRGGGHTPWAGAANIDAGVTLDMQSMNQVTISSDKKIVSVGPGNRWGHVYGPLDDQNLAMVGGRLSQVGVAGLVTGGGVSFFSGRYGLACNNIQTLEVVLGNGTVVTASSAKNPSIYRALKGGSNNFGIVTRFNAKLYSQSPFWGGSITQPATDKDAFFDFFVKFSVSQNYDPYSALIANLAWPGGVFAALLHTPTYTNGDVAWPPPAFKELDDMPKLATTIRKAKLSNFTNELGSTAVTTQGQNNLFVTLSFINDGSDGASSFLSAVFDLTNAAATKLVTVVGLIFTMTLQPFPHVLYSKDAASNVLGLDRFQDDLINLLFVLSWTLPTDNDGVYAVMKQLEQDVIALEKEMGVYNEWLYLNYAAQWQDPIGHYGAQSVAFMKGVSKAYDPKAIFQNAVPGGFKLGT